MAWVAELISSAVLRRHLETMDRLDIEYDFLPRESEILRLHFWDAAFQQLKEKDVLYFETEGKNKGCWVMKRPKPTLSLRRRRMGHPTEESSGAEEASGPDEDAKVIVRSNGTVGYVGKDIAYHLWKFGLLGLDFGYRKFYRYPNQHEVWISAEHGEPDHPHFGNVAAIYNVIDSRQADPQNTVIEALRLLGYTEQAAHYTHFSYEMVALTPRCAMELGYDVSEEDRAKSYIEVSGRKGFGVKADDLLDALIAAAKKEVDSRHPELNDEERARISGQIAIGALRYFMLKFTKQSVIAFDFKEALAFEGETGPYAQYAVVRASNIFRKAGVDPELALADRSGLRALFCRGERHGNLGAVVAGREDIIRGRAMHRDHGARVCGQTRVPARAAVQQLLPSPPYPYRSRRGPEEVPAGHRGCGSARVDSSTGRDGHHRAARDVAMMAY